VTVITTEEVAAVLQDRVSSDESAIKQSLNYLNIIRSSNSRGLVKYLNSCFTEFSKFTYVH